MKPQQDPPRAAAMRRNASEETGERSELIATANVPAYDGQIGQAA